MAIPTDPRFSDQWHLLQSEPGWYDLNVTRVWDDYTGRGVDVFVIDDAFDYNHSDISPNYDRTRDWGFELGIDDPLGATDESHGTAVMGLIGAANNGIGAVGVAFDATLVGYSIMQTDAEVWLNNIANALGHGTYAGADVFNLSQGMSGWLATIFGGELDPVGVAQVRNSIGLAVDDGRDGLGALIVKSAGNSRETEYDVNADGWTNDTRQIVVAAVDQDGDASWYSSYGAAILISAFGTDGQVVTTDRSDGGVNDTDITTTFSGTSAAAPMVAGVLALVLEANDKLGWRDVQDILAYSARHVGSAMGAGPATGEREAWQWNGADNWNGGGLHYSVDYGYGLIDALAAVRLAESWLLMRTAQTSSNQQSTTANVLTVPTTIPDNNADGTSFVVNETESIRIERVTVSVTFSSTYIGEVQVFLVSPDGTTSTLVNCVAWDESEAGADFSGTWTFESQAFRGEMSNGDWSVRVVDMGEFDEVAVSNIVLKTFGSSSSTADRWIFTNEYSDYAGLAGHAVSVGNSNGGLDVVNAAAVTSASILNLVDGAASRIDGVEVKFTGAVDAIGGDGNDVITGNTVANTLRGMRGDDVYVVQNTADRVFENAGQGLDEVKSSVDFVLGLNVERLTLTGTKSLNGTGNSAANTITGNAAANTLDGKGGADLLRGGAGSDIYVVDATDTVDESVSGSNGVDTVRAGFSFSLANTAKVKGSVEYLTLLGTGHFSGTGNGLNNKIVGNSGDNKLSGAAGNDYLEGGKGNDRLDGGTGTDKMYGGAGNDTYVVDHATDLVSEALSGSSGVDLVLSSISFSLASSTQIKGSVENLTLSGKAAINGTGNDLANVITGNSGKNVLNGQGGTDIITGGGGKDTLIGGGSKDTFVFLKAADSGATATARDVIKDFTRAYDKIDLKSIDAKSSVVDVLKGANDAFTFLAAEAKSGFAFTKKQGQLSWDKTTISGNKVTIVAGDINGDGKADFHIELSGHINLTKGDFIL